MMTTLMQSVPDVFGEYNLLLFVPGNRPDRFAKAAAAGADAVIIDLEDAVAVQDKDAARRGLEDALSGIDTSGSPFFVRINAAGGPWHEADVETVARLSVAGVMLPKAERASDLARLAEALGDKKRVIALVETARGLASACSLAEAAGRIAFGSIDFAADIRAAHCREALQHARATLVLASRLAGLPGPIDGVTTSISAAADIESDAAYAASLGFAGKLLIHPQQVAPAARGFRPAPDDVAWAQRVMAACAGGGAVKMVDGRMVDAPVRALAAQVLRRAARASPP